MHKRKLVKIYKYGEVIRVSAEITGPDPDSLMYRLGEEEDEDDTTHMESMFVVKKGLKHIGWPKPSNSVSAVIARRSGRGAWRVSKPVLARARKTLIRSRLRQFVLHKIGDFWRGLNIFDIISNASAFATLALLILLFFKER